MNKIIRLGDTVISSFGKYLAILAGTAVLAMMLVTVYGVMMRYFIHSPKAWPYEVGEFTLFAASCLAWGFVQYRRAHVRVETVVTRLPERASNITEVFNTLALFFYAVILTWAGYMLTVDSLDAGAHSIIMKIPLFPIKFMLALGAFALCLQVLVHIREAIGKAIRKGK